LSATEIWRFGSAAVKLHLDNGGPETTRKKPDGKEWRDVKMISQDDTSARAERSDRLSAKRVHDGASNVFR